MNQEIKNRLEKYYQEQEDLLKKEKKALKEEELIYRGLYDLEFCDEIKEGYVYSVKHEKYVKKIALAISDEDYENIKKYKIEKNDDDQVLQQVIKGIGIAIFIIGFIVGLFSFRNEASIGIGIWFSSFITGTLFLALSKIIELLEDIKKNTEKSNE